ncbi:hypothetical protein COU15_01580 [Candidatus Kaiserbacteria bacterium CG10_big_fil_rev_8_21_14_0_10_45_20]|uniref:Uncharacterized protein n=1 Tax=Candidatus Kaiserbacteria bacterium CG10_big_fil_rev_8_21_14_0_10_45_20 TaxID=1974607 RepID=A0A2H0UFT8_9BACT|nr:MAG: hypothetical protein COU15_01580 [Candidatus Kaiserbacteria bacterium CG10_big_fil_rev_8_21_14_0_10_45_20]
MGIFSWIEETRQKTPLERRRVAFSIALSVTLGIGVVWLVGFLIHVSSLFSSTKQEPATPAPATEPLIVPPRWQ